MKGVPRGGTGVEELRREEAIWTLSVTWNGLQTELLRSDSRLGSLIILSGTVHTRVEVCRMYSDFPPSSEVATTQQTDGAAHKLKLRSFHKSAHLRVHSVDFHPGVNRA